MDKGALRRKPTWIKYSRLQFLHVVSHSVGAHTDALQPRADSSDSDDDADVVDLTNEGPVTLPASSASTSSASAASAAPDDSCEVCLVEPRQGFDRAGSVQAHALLR